MQLCKNHVNLKHCIGHNVNVKTAHSSSNFLKKLISQEIFVLKYIFKKKKMP